MFVEIPEEISLTGTIFSNFDNTPPFVYNYLHHRNLPGIRNNLRYKFADYPRVIIHYFKGVFIWRKNIPAKRGPRLSKISPYKRVLLKNQNLFT